MPATTGVDQAAEAIRADLHMLVDTARVDPQALYRYTSDLATVVARAGELARHLHRLSDALAERNDLYHDESGDLAVALNAATTALQAAADTAVEAAWFANSAATELGHIGHR